MMAERIIIDTEACCWKDGRCTCIDCCDDTGECVGCAEICPAGAITRKDIVIVDHDECTLCRDCIEVCQNNAISIRKGDD